MDTDGALLWERRLRGSVTYRNYKAPGRRDLLTRRGARWAVAVTRKGLLVDGSLGTFIDTAWSDPRLAGIRVSVESDHTLLVAFEAGVFHEDRSGQVEIRVRTSQAQQFADIITECRGDHE